MQENNFEKQVQGKMEDLKINPSAELWQKVSMQVEKKKRDHRILVVCLSALILVIIGGVTWMNKTSNQTNQTNKPTFAASTETLKDSATGTANLTEPATVNAKENNAIAFETNEQLKNGERVQSNQEAPPGSKLSVSRQNEENERSLPVEKTAVNKLFSTSVSHKAGGSNDASGLTVNNKSQSGSDVSRKIGNADAAEQANLHAEKVLALEQSLSTSENLKVSPTVVIQPNLSAVLPRPKKASSWKIGMNLSIGVSNTRDGYLSIVSASDENKAYDQSSPIGNVGNSGNPGIPTSSTSRLQSPVEMNLGFIAGVFVQREISRKTNVQVGLNYKYYSTKMMIGSKVDSSGLGSQLGFSSVYRAGNQQEYINKYHFIEIPFGINMRISAPYKLPVYVYTGLSISTLVGSNALQFNNVNYTYYHDNNVFNKAQVDLSAKLLFAISRSKQNSLLVGPQLNYSLGKMANTGIYKDRNYSYFGITLQKNIF